MFLTAIILFCSLKFRYFYKFVWHFTPILLNDLLQRSTSVEKVFIILQVTQMKILKKNVLYFLSALFLFFKNTEHFKR